MYRRIIGLAAVLTACLMLTGPHAIEAQGAVGRTQVWADCDLYDSVVAPTTFSPTTDPFDKLFSAAFMSGIGLISESSPGDTDYNGGRWQRFVLKIGVDVNKYQNACSVDQLDLNDFEPVGHYFECPLLPRNGEN